jgi:hypothetical protein
MVCKCLLQFENYSLCSLRKIILFNTLSNFSWKLAWIWRRAALRTFIITLWLPMLILKLSQYKVASLAFFRITIFSTLSLLLTYKIYLWICVNSLSNFGVMNVAFISSIGQIRNGPIVTSLSLMLELGFLCVESIFSQTTNMFSF